MISPVAILAIDRWLDVLALFFIWGACGFLALLVPRTLAHDVEARMSTAVRVAIATVVVVSALRLPIEATMIGNGWPDALDAGLVGSVLLQTSVGAAWQAQMAITLLLLAGQVVPRGWRGATTALAAGLSLVARTLTGHAAMHEGAVGAVHRANDGFHLLAGGAWLGALVPLPLILGRLHDPAKRSEASAALRRFSRAGHAAVAVVLATGVMNAILVLDGWPATWASPYLILLLIKIGLVMVMTALAIFNRYALVPQLSTQPARSLRSLRTITLAEIALGAAVLALVAVFGLLEPG